MKLLSIVIAVSLAAAAPALAQDTTSHAEHHPANNAAISSPQSPSAPQTGMMSGCPMKGNESGSTMMQNGSMSDGMMMHSGGQMHAGNAMQCPMMKNEVPSKPAEGTGASHN